MAASKDARSAAAKKRASARAAGRTRSTMATPGQLQEAGVTSASVAKIVQQVIKQMGKKPAAKPKPSSASKPKTMSASEYQKEMASTRAANKSYRDAQTRAASRETKDRQAKAKSDTKVAKSITKRAAKEGKKGSTLRYNIKYGNR